MSQKLFNLNINFFSSSAQAENEDSVILKPGSEFESDEFDIEPAADILEFAYPPESPFYKGDTRKSA